jgi:hypothetical protein
MTNPTQAQQIAELQEDLAEAQYQLGLLGQAHVQLEALTAALLTVAERNGTSGWATLARLLTVLREPVTEYRRSMVQAADILARRTLPAAAGARLAREHSRSLTVHRGNGGGGPSSRGSLTPVA